MPKKNTYLNFRNHCKKLPLPFVAYVDFEFFTKPMDNCEPDSNSSFPKAYKRHKPCGFCFYIKPLDNISSIKFDKRNIVYTRP